LEGCLEVGLGVSGMLTTDPGLDVARGLQPAHGAVPGGAGLGSRAGEAAAWSRQPELLAVA